MGFYQMVLMKSFKGSHSFTNWVPFLYPEFELTLNLNPHPKMCSVSVPLSRPRNF